jgi:hypothetical protein
MYNAQIEHLYGGSLKKSRWVIILLGIIASLAGVTGAISRLMRDLFIRQNLSAADLPTGFLEALRALIETLIRAPIWLVLLLFGFALIVYGGTLIVRPQSL